MFIVLESIDGGGKGKQREELLDFFSKSEQFNEITGEEFPVHDVFYESVIHPALQEQTKLNRASWILSFLLDKTLHSDRIGPFMHAKDNLFLADGYFTTTIAYQSLLMNQVSLDKILEYAKDFEIPKPDLTIFIDVDPAIAFQRKNKEEGHDEGLDMFEKSVEKQEKLREIFKRMASENIFGQWEIVDGNLGIQEVRDQIIERINKALK